MKMLVTLHQRYILLSAIVAITILTSGFYLRYHPSSVSFLSDTSSPEPTVPRYKPPKPAKSYPIVDNFPRALNAHSAADLPTIPKWNQPPIPHVSEKTPLFIGFTRNWRLLQQVVVSYITAGWPASDIYVVENTGVMYSNKNGELSLQNPFFLNHTRLEMLGVNILITPTLFTFAQLQNYYVWVALERKWDQYFWSHMDLVVLSFEDQWKEEHPDEPTPPPGQFQSIYDHCVTALRNAITPDAETGKMKRWALKFFSYDRLALVNTEAYVDVGGWDTMIPFYMTDCDMHERLAMAGYSMEESPAGKIWDVGSSLDDIEVLYRKKGGPEPSFVDPNAVEEELAKASVTDTQHQAKDIELSNWASKNFSLEDKKEWVDEEVGEGSWAKLLDVLDHMTWAKSANTRGRNTWQSRQVGGQEDPFYRDSEGFEEAIIMTIDHGKRVFAEKWGHRDCDLVRAGLKIDDAWRVEHDW